SLSVPTAGPSGALTILPGTFVVTLGTSAIPAAASAIPPGDSTVPAGSPNVPTDVPSSTAPAGVSSKGKSLIVEEDIPVKARTFKQMEEDRLGEEAAKRLHDEKMAQMERQRAEVQRKRQHDVLDSAMYYNKADWLNIKAQFEANASLSKTLLGDDMSEDTFPARMAALIKQKRQALAEKLAKERQNRPMTQAQQKAYITLKRTGFVLEEPSSKRQQSTEAPILPVPEVPLSLVVSSPPSSRTRRKSLGRKHILKPKSTLPKLDLAADTQTFIKVVVTEDSDDKVTPVWSAVVGWEVLLTPLGEINALYRIDGSTTHFTTLRQILHMVDDLVKLYGLVVQYYEHHPVAGAGLIFWSDLQELDSDMVGNDMTTAEQLIQFIKNQLAAAQASSV
nr:JmjC domain-containing protein [Tanacetum cinerariifolium]